MYGRKTSKSKYGNTKTETRGIKFDSKAEASRFEVLLKSYAAGVIRDLKLQPTFTIQEAYKTVDGETVKAITYKADFSYREIKKDINGETYWKLVVEDVKGVRTEVYKIKKKLMKEKFGIDIVEIS